ncbi:hypothetical protein GGS23DRAFT_103928 [Durotheca rogersii]|uniref:uncharacterized protein n=1 Tax=Durotheca rogersii TaxID=419775 RepID=UPI0022205503|nr:uncharacterized protein GGS23DRAFT_103928 [Durotheca rogersii]KAI5862083.1 hypothetical protein GGS23DRAFT_103928 [Durotheca rogersii]
MEVTHPSPSAPGPGPPPPPPPTAATQPSGLQTPPVSLAPATDPPLLLSDLPANIGPYYPNGPPRTINGLGNAGSYASNPNSVSDRNETPPAPPATQPLPYQSLSRQPSLGSLHKIPIRDPPSWQTPLKTNYHPPQGFPSPKGQHQPLGDTKSLDDLSRLVYAIQQSVPAAVRRAVRENWEKTLLGSEFHHAFLLNAIIHHSNGTIIRRSIKDFGSRMVAESKHEIVHHFKPSDLDELASEILDKASNSFLDLALEKRLRTIDARSLISALARAERLGYEDSDILDDQSPRGAAVPPVHASPIVTWTPVKLASNTQLGQGDSAGNPSRRSSTKVWQCPLCGRNFDSEPPYKYHMGKQVCTKEPPTQQGFLFACKPCGAGFITKAGQQYHQINQVCLRFGTGMPITLTAPIAIPSDSDTPEVAPSPPAVHPISSSFQEHDPYAHLDPTKLELLNEELRHAEIVYAARFKDTEKILDPNLRRVKLEGLQNSFSTKQSNIRRKYGVKLRNRRTRAEIADERGRMGLRNSHGGFADDTPSAKRQRTDYNASFSGSQVLPVGNDPGGPEQRSNHIAVSDMNAGLGGSVATAATTDPTQSQSQATTENNLSSYQRKGYRISSHQTQMPSSHNSPTTDVKMEDGPDPTQLHPQTGSASAPVTLDDSSSPASSSDDTDSDEDIPASLPRKTSGTPLRGLTG